jgi:hypothetical protein
MKLKEELAVGNNSGNQLSISNISFNEPVSPMNNSSEPAAIPASKNDSTEEPKKDLNSLRRKSTLLNTLKEKPKPSGKFDLAASFLEASGVLLDLSNRHLSDMHSNDLHKNIKSHPLKQLILANNKLTDEGAIHVLKAVALSQLESLSLANNKISEKCTENIVYTLKTSKALKHLDLTGNGITSRLMKNKLKNALPSIEVLV